jgi:hypothetical protein
MRGRKCAEGETEGEYSDEVEKVFPYRIHPFVLQIDSIHSDFALYSEINRKAVSS